MKKVILSLMLLLSNFILSQKKELGKVTIEELLEKSHSKEPDAVAAVIFKKGEVRFDYSQDNGFDMITTVKVKIKIYKKEGYNYANFSQRYYIGANAKESLNFSNAITYNVLDGKIEKSKLKKESIFDEKVNKFWNRKKIAMPNVKEGSIVEFEYVIKSDEIGTMEDWEFQSDIPVDYSEFATYIPEYFVYNINQKGYLFPKVERDVRQRTIDYVYKEDFVPGLNTGTPQRIKTSLNFKENLVTFVANDFSSLKDEMFVNNIKNYLSSVSHELSMVKFPDQPYKVFSTDWESVTKTIYENENFGTELNKTNYFENDIDILIKGLNTQEEKITTIFNFVKSKLKWNGYFGYNCDIGVKKAYTDKSGNVADINLMLTAMLRYIGLDSNPILVSTRSNGIALFPNRIAYNYVIASVKLDSELILLDATDSNSIPNILPIRDLNWYGRLIRKDGTSENVDLMPKINSSENVNMIASIDSQGTILGQMRGQYFDYYAYEFREKNANLTIDSYLEKLEKKYSGLEIENYERNNEKETYQPIIEKYSFKSNNFVEIIGDKMYFSPLLYLALTENPFKQEVREYPIDFSYPTKDKYLISINIPEGYMVESFPKETAIALPENYGNFRFTCTVEEKKIQLVVNLNINAAIIPSDDYDTLKEFFKKVVEKENEKIVLKKA